VTSGAESAEVIEAQTPVQDAEQVREPVAEEAPKPAKKGRKAKKADTGQQAAQDANEAGGAEQPAPEPKKRKGARTGAQDADEAPKRQRKVNKSKAAAMTLADLSEAYVRHLDEAGKSIGTQFSYDMELRLAQAELGAETLVSDFTPETILAFFEGDRVTKTKSGRSKAKPSIDKTRRVMRQALVWAEERGIVETAPLPEEYTKRSEKK